jgi:uncharacterized protein (DUF433 family)
VSDEVKPRVGDGIYTVPEAAHILDLPVGKVRRWLGKYWEMNFLEQSLEPGGYTWGQSWDKAFNFHTLIEIIAVHSLRESGVSFQKIKTAHKVLGDILGTKYPFSTSRMLTDGKAVFYDDELSLLALDRDMQRSFKKIVEPFCRKIDFDCANFLAERFWPLGKNHGIVVDPHHSFGQPIIVGTNITVDSLLTLIRAGEDKMMIASLYEISPDKIEDVYIFSQRLVA